MYHPDNTELKPIIVAIDGFSSSGKSTMARSLARRLGFRYIDSGAMYRAVALYALRHGMVGVNTPVNTEAVTAALPLISINFEVQPDGTQHTVLNGRDVEDLIRGLEVSEVVSSIAAIPAVRHNLVAKQQAFGSIGNIVMDGRDIGTTVFPDADLKVFVNAPAETRARRRYAELEARGDQVSYEEILENVRQRDHIDTTRAESPLRKATDAIELDNSDMTIEQQNAWLDQAVARARSKK